jgi:hypothetical protein
MKTTRYFKATDGKITVFRASETKAYAFATFKGEKLAEDHAWCGQIGFSAKAGDHPAVEITKAEYEALVAQKTARINAKNEARKAEGKRVWSVGPSDSWVQN